MLLQILEQQFELDDFLPAAVSIHGEQHGQHQHPNCQRTEMKGQSLQPLPRERGESRSQQHHE